MFFDFSLIFIREIKYAAYINFFLKNKSLKKFLSFVRLILILEKNKYFLKILI